MKIGLLSDTHSFLDPQLDVYLKACDQVWHAGDFGSDHLFEELNKKYSLRGVWGNIDSMVLRKTLSETLVFEEEGVKVVMTHIGGYPGKYPVRIKKMLTQEKPHLFICGHSHILKIIPDPAFSLLHINPGAAGREGFHLEKTLVRFELKAGKVEKMEVISLGKRGSINS